VIAASGTITQLIPPSLVLVVLADQLGRSVGDMYAGAIGPSIIQLGLFCAWVAIVSVLWPKDVPALPLEARTLKGWALWIKCLRGIVPSLGRRIGIDAEGVSTPRAADLQPPRGHLPGGHLEAGVALRAGDDHGVRADGGLEPARIPGEARPPPV